MGLVVSIPPQRPLLNLATRSSNLRTKQPIVSTGAPLGAKLKQEQKELRVDRGPLFFLLLSCPSFGTWEKLSHADAGVVTVVTALKETTSAIRDTVRVLSGVLK